jgi:MFS transporter, PPP family, 3-phenylpropionic acid transporter
LLIGIGVDNLPLLIAAQCLHAATFGSFHASGIELMRRFFRGGHQGQGQALYSGLSYGAGGAAGAAVSGIVWDVAPQFTFIFASLISMLALLLTTVLLRGPEFVSSHSYDQARITSENSAI